MHSIRKRHGIASPGMLVVIVVTVATAGLAAAEADADASRLVQDLVVLSEQDLQAREDHGFNASADHVAALIASGTDVGTREYGFPMTAEEVQEVEVRASRVQLAYESGFVTEARSRDDFGGIYVDHANGGRLVVLVTGSPERATSELTSVAPDPAFVEVRQVAVSYRELDDAQGAIMDHPNGLVYTQNLPIHAVGIDEKNNRLRITVDPAASESIAILEGVLTNALPRIPYVIEYGGAETDQVCTSREICYSLMKAGNVIRKGSTSGA